MTRFILLLIILVFLFISCQEEDIFLPDIESDTDQERDKSYPNVSDELWPYFESFEKEAALRGIDIDLTTANITGEISKIHENGIVGMCSHGGRRSFKEIVIDSQFWNRANSSFREYIVFHELGHCFLFRQHREDCFENGTWVSIMRSGTLTICRDNYNSQTKRYYVDELFGLVNN